MDGVDHRRKALGHCLCSLSVRSQILGGGRARRLIGTCWPYIRLNTLARSLAVSAAWPCGVCVCVCTVSTTPLIHLDLLLVISCRPAGRCRVGAAWSVVVCVDTRNCLLFPFNLHSRSHAEFEVARRRRTTMGGIQFSAVGAFYTCNARSLYRYVKSGSINELNEITRVNSVFSSS